MAGRTYELGAHQDMDQGLLERIFAESTSTDPDGQPVSLPEGVGHRDALAAISGTHQLVVVTGAAGSGKTTLLKAAKHVGAVKGVEQVIVTPTAKAAEVAAAETGSSASTVHALLRAYGYRWETDKATRLEDRLPKLDSIVFHEKLGTQGEQFIAQQPDFALRVRRPLLRRVGPHERRDGQHRHQQHKEHHAPAYSGPGGQKPS